MAEYRIVRFNSSYFVQYLTGGRWVTVTAGEHVCIKAARRHKKDLEHFEATGDYEVVE